MFGLKESEYDKWRDFLVTLPEPDRFLHLQFWTAIVNLAEFHGHKPHARLYGTERAEYQIRRSGLAGWVDDLTGEPRLQASLAPESDLSTQRQIRMWNCEFRPSAFPSADVVRHYLNRAKSPPIEGIDEIRINTLALAEASS